MSLNQQAIKRGAVATLTLQPFPPSIAARDPKLAADLEQWRRQAETTLHSTIMALKLDLDRGNISVTLAELDAIEAELRAEINLRVLRAGDTMGGQLKQNAVPVATNDLTNKAYVDAKVSEGAVTGHIHFVQPAPLATWTIPYPWALEPDVVVKNSVGIRMFGQEDFSTPGVVLIKFNGGQTGTADLIV